MNSLHLKTSTDTLERNCGCIGGKPELPTDSGWPLCRICGDELVAYFDIVLPAFEQSPFIPGSRLQIFACREHSDISGTIYSDYTRSSKLTLVNQLPPSYWNISDGHYVLRLLPPSQTTVTGKVELRLKQQFLTTTDNFERSFSSLKLFGNPDWVQDPEEHTCACGSLMVLLLQVPDGFGFQMAVGALEQPDSFSNSQYCLFLGNQLYLFGCSSQCDSRALWPVLQN